MRRRHGWKRGLLLVLSAAVAFAGIKNSLGRKKEQRHFELSEELELTVTNADDIIEVIHDGLAKHARSFTVTYKAGGDYLKEIEQLADELVNYAMYNTDSPTEGDYVRYQYGGYKLSYGKSDSGKDYEYQMIITPTYYSTVQEEQKVNEKVGEILEDLSIGKEMSDREKVQAVYDYICSNVRYDHVHEHTSNYYKDSTAYAALVENYASCQGYAVAVFRLLKELGVECTVITGIGINDQGKEEFHAWNQVMLEEKSYNLDATWDAGKEEYDYFLIEDAEFINHKSNNCES